MTRNPTIPKFPRWQCLAGLLLIAAAWALSWLPEFTHAPVTGWALSWLPKFMEEPHLLRTHVLFFPLWTGYALVVDGLVYGRKGASLLRRNGWAFVGLFLVSAPAWWFFELLNAFSHNWEYVGKEFFTDWEYGILASIAFSTVIPAVFGTAELVGTFGWVKRLPPGPVLRPTRRTQTVFLILGIGMFAGIVALPRYFFPCLWLAPYFTLEVANQCLGNRSLLDYTKTGDWRPVVALWAGTLTCGFFWEMWNYYSYPKWIYHVPFVGVGHIFEMPLLGYGGYLPFGMELFALYHLVIGLIGKKQTLSRYVDIG